MLLLFLESVFAGGGGHHDNDGGHDDVAKQPNGHHEAARYGACVYMVFALVVCKWLNIEHKKWLGGQQPIKQPK